MTASFLGGLAISLPAQADPPPAGGGGEATTIEVRVAGGLDDAEEHLTEGNAIDITSSDLELGEEGGAGDTQAIGIRFRNVNIPAGATISRATIQFTVDEADDEPTSVQIFGQLDPNPAEFTTTVGDITARTKTAASVPWDNIPLWNDASIGSAGPDQRTPDLSAIVQELVGQAGWAAGNAMAFIIMPNPGGERTAESFDGDAGAAPLLQIEFVAPSAPPTDGAVASSTGAISAPAVVNFGALSDSVSYEFVFYAVKGGASTAIAGDDAFAIKLDQWNEQGVFGTTQFGVADNLFTPVADQSVASVFGRGVHVVVVSDTTAGESRLYIDGKQVGTWGGTFLLSGDVKVMGARLTRETDHMGKGSVMYHWATYQGTLSDAKIAELAATWAPLIKGIPVIPGLSAGAARSTPGDGLFGQYWKRNPVSILTDGASNRANGIDKQIQGFGNPSGTFNAKLLTYTGNDLTEIGAWLAGDAASFSGTPGNLDDGAFRFSGFLNIAQPGLLNIGTTSDDGSRISIGGTDIINNDGSHGDATVDADVNFAAAGIYPIEITFFNGDWTSDGADNHSGSTDPSLHGGANFHLRIAGADVTPADVEKYLYTAPEPNYVHAGLAVNTPLAAAGDGLKGEYWKRDPVSILVDGASNRANGIDQQILGFGDPSGTFTATTLNYTGNDLTEVVPWLGADGASFSGTPGNLDDGAFRFTGFINVATPGKLSLGTTSDDGSRIKIGGIDLVNNDGSHGDETKDAEVNFAAAGVYPIEVTYFNGDWTSDGADNHSGSTDPSLHGGANFHLRVAGADVTAETAAMFFTTPTGPPAPKALLVVGTASVPNLNAADTGVKAHLESLGFQVTTVDAPSSTTASADGMALIVTSSTVNSGDVGDKFQGVAVPLVNWEQALQDNYLMTGNAGTDHGTSADQTTLEIVNSAHPLAGGLAKGVVTVSTSPQPWSWGLPAAGAVTIAHVAGNPAQVAIYGYEAGAVMFDGAIAPARRVMLFGGDDTFANLTPEGLALYDAGLRWAAGLPPAFTKGKVVWVSFHPADDTPNATAAGVGLTEASDRGYTALLRESGYEVTRFVTANDLDVNTLPAGDLVIISRAVPSGHYQQANETAAWNGLARPVMILGGYILRNSRLGFTTGGTIPDTAGDVKLTVNDPSHPVFSGVSLDADNTMVNVYAGIESFAGQDPPLVQRGISVNTDPVAGNGTVLATIGTADDPAAGGMVIGEWQPGAVMGNASADVLGGPRLVFLTGSREASGFTGGDAAGFFDLEPDGQKMFLNAVEYMVGKSMAGGPAFTAITVSGGNLTIEWSGGGTLESAANVTGPWTAVAGATSPFTAPASDAAGFFRVRQ